MRQSIVPHSERGSVLIISLIMLVVLTLLAVSAIKMGTMSLRVLNGAQARSEAMWAAENAIDRVLNSDFSKDIGGVAGSYTIPIDDSKSYTVTMATPCLKQLVTIKNSELDMLNEEDKKCFDATTNPYSACAKTVWQLTASTNDGFFGASATVTQGVAVRMEGAAALAYMGSSVCP